ncbi:MAG: sulfotransferase [Proteobacteria bacterium]|nr:sulfotransferase [Pseudomonadota bacterium]
MYLFALDHARSLYDAGRHAEAESAILELLASGNAATEVFRLLALVQRALNDPAREARALEQALAVISQDASPAETARLWARLGAVRAWRGDPVHALAAYERAAEIAPDDAESLQGIARTQFALQDLDAAHRSARLLERKFPDSAFSHLFAGHVHKAMGDAPAAAHKYVRALECDALSGEALYNLVDLEIPPPDSNTAARAAYMAACDDLPAADRINANFARARILDAAGQYAEAFEALQCANDTARLELAGRGIRYLPQRVEEAVALTIADYDESSFGSRLDPLPIDIRPIFITGLPRSGTTLIEQVLASHSEVQAAGEVIFARECEYLFRQRREAAGRSGPIDPDEPADAELLEFAREQYIERLFERGLDARWIVDKLPANFEIAGFLRLAFPQSPILHTVRDPRANCFSLYCANFSSHEPWYHDLDDLAHYHRQYSRLAAHWQRVISPPLVNVVYEELVRDPQNRIPMLLSAIGLSFDPACLEFYRHRRPIFTASHSQARRPVYTGAIDHWKNYGNRLGPLLELSEESK